MKDADNDILFTMKVNEMKVCMEGIDRDILGLGLGFLITSSLMWISNRRRLPSLSDDIRIACFRWKRLVVGKHRFVKK